MSRIQTIGDSYGGAMPAIVPGAAVDLVVGVTSNESSEFAGDGLHRFCADTDCWVLRGAAPTATGAAPDTYLPANTPEYFVLRSGDKVSVIRESADGFLNITPAASTP